MYLITNLFTGKYLYDARISKKWNENIPSWMLRYAFQKWRQWLD